MFGVFKNIGVTAALGTKFNELFKRTEIVTYLYDSGDSRANNYLLCLIFYNKRDIVDVINNNCTTDFKTQQILNTKLLVPSLSTNQRQTVTQLVTTSTTWLYNFVKERNDRMLNVKVNGIIDQGGSYFYLDSLLPKDISKFHLDSTPPIIL